MPWTTYDIDGITVIVAPIEHDGERLTRRQRERATVRAVLDVLVGPYTVMEHNADGAPVINGWNVSISHSAKYAAVAVSRDKIIGIDAEEWRDALVRVKTKYLTEAETARITEPQDLLRAWTVKEAVYKAAAVRALRFSADIAIAPDWSTARSPRASFRLESWRHGDTQLTLAIKQSLDSE